MSKEEDHSRLLNAVKNLVVHAGVERATIAIESIDPEIMIDMDIVHKLELIIKKNYNVYHGFKTSNSRKPDIVRAKRSFALIASENLKITGRNLAILMKTGERNFYKIRKEALEYLETPQIDKRFSSVHKTIVREFRDYLNNIRNYE